MATPTSSDTETPTVLVQASAWGYVLLPADHPGVRQAWAQLTSTRECIRWDLIAEIAQLAGRAADDLIIVGDDEVNEMLAGIHAKLVASVRHERSRR